VNADRQNDWRIPYQAALLELDPAKLSQRIEQAYQAIQMSMDLAHKNSNDAEHRALADALANLRVLRREILATNSNHEQTKLTASHPQCSSDP